MAKTIPYYFYKKVDGMDVHKELLGDKYSITFRDEDGKFVGVLFHFDYNGDLIIDNVYKNRTNYKSYRYIKKYAENKKLINAMMELRNN